MSRVNYVDAISEQVERQLAAWKNLGVAISDEQWEHILQQADAFGPVTANGQPLVTGGFGYGDPKTVVDKLFEAFAPPEGYTKQNYYMGDAELRYAPDMKPKGELRLVRYEPNAYAGVCPKLALQAATQDRVRLAGIEVLEYLVLNPQSGLTWDGKLSHYPCLSGLQRRYTGVWSGVPYLDLWTDFRQFRFRSVWAHNADDEWSSPVVREL